jgi:beta-lactamase regulating signal transducer with metallopeptidase domain
MMSVPAHLDSFAALALNRMLYGLAEGTLLAALVSLVMRWFPPKNSRTRFTVWLASLIVVAVLPLLGAAAQTFSSDPHSVASHTALLTIPPFWAESILAIWVAMALLGLLRIGAGWWHVRRMRRSSVAISSEFLGTELQSAIAQVRLSRPVSILVSPSASVPAAVGFVKPVVVIPAWLAEEGSTEELGYVLRHEFAHLRRWDDWTNLFERLVKAVLFFHPGIWWIERKLSLDREMACDEAVLREVPEPRLYAECLARVAERSFLRRQLALAQAAVDRMKHLSLRVARILSPSSNEQQRGARSTRLWKPAVATVAAVTALSVAWTAHAPVLVRLADPAAARVQAAAEAPAAVTTTNVRGRQVEQHLNVARSVNTNTHPADMVPALYQPTRGNNRTAHSQGRKRPVGTQRQDPTKAWYMTSETTSNAPGGALITVIETRYVTGGQAAGAVWQISVVEVQWLVPANHAKKEIPRKT